MPGVDTAAAEAFLKQHAPLRMSTDFDCGLLSADFETFEPFNPRPLFKLEQILTKISCESGVARERLRRRIQYGIEIECDKPGVL